MDFGKTMPDEERTRLISPQTVLKFLDFEQVFVFKICTQISRFSLGEIAETTVLLTGSSGGGPYYVFSTSSHCWGHLDFNGAHDQDTLNSERNGNEEILQAEPRMYFEPQFSIWHFQAKQVYWKNYRKHLLNFFWFTSIVRPQIRGMD